MEKFKQNTSLLMSLLVLTSIFSHSAKAADCPIPTINGDFETPTVTTWDPNYYYANIPDNTANIGWKTDASSKLIEFRHFGTGPFDPGDTAPAAQSGNQYIELNSTEAAAIYQDFATTPGYIFTCKFYHRGRKGSDTFALSAGSPGSTVNLYNYTSDNLSWHEYTFTYTVPNGQTITRFQFDALSSAGGNVLLGNFLDNITFTGTTPPPTVRTPIKYCQGDIALPLTATTATGGTLVWHTASTGGSPISTPTPSTTSSGTVDYYVSQWLQAGCESERVKLSVITNALPTATIAGSTTVNIGAALPNITFTGANGVAPYTFTYNINGGANQTVVSTGLLDIATVPLLSTAVASTFTYNLISVKDNYSSTCTKVITGELATIIVQSVTPTITLSITPTISEGIDLATVTATLSSAPTTDISLHLGINSSSTANGASDYSTSISPLEISLKAGFAGPYTFTINPLEDNIAEPAETVSVEILPSAHYIIGGTNPVTTTILAQTPVVNLTIDNYTIDEKGGMASITATLTQISTQAVTIVLEVDPTSTASALAPNIDYTLPNGLTITIPAGQKSQTIQVVIAKDDAVYEPAPNETIIFGIKTVTNCTKGVSTVATAIIDNYTPSVTLSIDSASIHENFGNATITATLINPSRLTVTVVLEINQSLSIATNGVDYTTGLLTLVFAPNEIKKTIQIKPIVDDLAEPMEKIVVDISTVTNCTVGNNPSVETNIIDVYILPVVNLTVNTPAIAENGGKATFTASLNKTSNQAVTINLGFSASSSATAGIDFTNPNNYTLTFLSGVKSQTFTVTSLDDINFEPINETIILDILSGVNCTRGISGATTAIIDDYTSTVTISIDSAVIHEKGGVATITATLNNPSTKDIIVTLKLDSSAKPATLNSDFSSTLKITIPFGQTSGTVEITAIDEKVVEKGANETIKVSIDTATNAIMGSPSTQQTEIIDNDNNPPVINDKTLIIEEKSSNGMAIYDINEVATTTDNDIDNETIVYSVINTNNTGAIDFNKTTGVFTVVDHTLLQPANQPSVTFVIEATDGIDSNKATIVFNINPNHKPTAQPDFLSIGQGSVVDIDILSNDTGLEDKPLALTITAPPQNGEITIINNTAKYSSNINFKGTDTFTYQICDIDNECSNALVTIDVAGLTTPQGFSPNGDGLNDTFVIPELEEYNQIQITVFNRWGSMVYQDEHYNNKWDGTPNIGILFGTELPVGTYYYVVSVVDNGRKICKYVYLTR